MFTSITDYAVLSNGVGMPCFGLGTYLTPDQISTEAVRWAIEAGYRHIDTASIYENESGVGKGVRQSGVPREEIFITTKLWNSDQGYDSVFRAFNRSLKKLDMDYVDLYLIHWPVASRTKDTWRALEKLYGDKRVRAIGVSNFNIDQLEGMMSACEIAPMVNQVECHPRLLQSELRRFCSGHNIKFEAWSPLMKGNLKAAVLTELAEKYGKTPAQVLLRWDIQNDMITIPKSVHKERIIENTQIFDFMLSDEDMKKIGTI